MPAQACVMAGIISIPHPPNNAPLPTQTQAQRSMKTLRDESGRATLGSFSRSFSTIEAT